jgi:diguanylate cyclase (GGDEF)-like protein
MALQRELDALRLENERLSQLAYRDPLTGLRNRRFLRERLGEELHRRLRGTSSGVSVISVDLNGFKRLNDAKGHLAGDVALQAVGEYLELMVRAEDLCCRTGGDEFTVLLPDTTATQGEAVLARLRAGLSALASAGLGPRGLALGAASWTPGDDDVALLARADAAMYADKRCARKRPPLDSSASVRSQLSTAA